VMRGHLLILMATVTGFISVLRPNSSSIPRPSEVTECHNQEEKCVRRDTCHPAGLVTVDVLCLCRGTDVQLPLRWAG
jgi:hypothetical protein